MVYRQRSSMYTRSAPQPPQPPQGSDRFVNFGCFHFVAISWLNPAGSSRALEPLGDDVSGGCARCFATSSRQSASAALHHSAGPMEKVEMQQNGALRGLKNAARAGEVEEQVTHAGLRAQKTPPPGARPGILAEPGPQRTDRTSQGTCENCCV